MRLGRELTMNLRNEKHTSRGYVKFAYNAQNNALMVTKADPDTDENFFTVTIDGSGTGAMPTLPKSLRAQKLPRGLYRPHPKHPNVYVWDKEKTEDVVPNVPTNPAKQDIEMPAFYDDENPDVAVGDHVCWLAKNVLGDERAPNVRQMMICTGSVVKLGDKKFPDDITHHVAYVKILNKSFLEKNPTASPRIIKISNLIVRRKRDA
jgi:hypothetical protein